MKSALPKVLHKVAGRPIVGWVLHALEAAGVGEICLVLSEERQGFERFLEGHPQVRVAVQKNRLGTGDAVAASAWSFAGIKPAPYASGYALEGRGAPLKSRYVLICFGDVPGIRPQELAAFIGAFKNSGAALGVLGMRLDNPTGYGRLVTDGGGFSAGKNLKAIIEERDADDETRRVQVCNTGVTIAETKTLFDLLQKLTPDNAQREYYLTDIVQHAYTSGLKTMAHVASNGRDFSGINDRQQLANVETWLVGRLKDDLMLSGVTMRLPATIYIDAAVRVEVDVELGPCCRIYGKTTIGAKARIGAGVTLVDATVAPGAEIGASSVINGTVIEAGERVPPLSVRMI